MGLACNECSKLAIGERPGRRICCSTASSVHPNSPRPASYPSSLQLERRKESMHPAIAAVAIAFWIFVGVTAIAAMILDYRKRKLALEPLRIAIEHGQQLDPEIITRLLGREERKESVDPQ